jgi:hypothetical protein
MKPRLLGDSTWNHLEYEYAHDSSVYLKGKKTYYTAEGFSIPTVSILSNTVDQSTNQYSNLYLTDKKKLSDFIGLRIENQLYPRTYVTYFADSYGWVDNISPKTECWYVEDSASTEEEMKALDLKPVFRVDAPYRTMSNSMLFEVEMLTDTHLKVSHWDGYKRSFLTVNTLSSTIYFDFEEPETTGSDTTQIFEYSYDEITSYTSIYKSVNDEYFEFTRIGPVLKLTSTLGWQYIPNSFKNAQITNRERNIPIYDTWVSYIPDLSQNNVNINPERSHTDVIHNYMINTEYIYNDADTNFLNILPLKNHITNQHQLSRNNPFKRSTTINTTVGETEPETLFRDYTSLSTGCNQVYGTDNIHVNYRDYTELLVFKTDKLTYFHMPPDMYPYRKLNIEDSGLIESGAIAGDQPARSDKVFKKRADYEEYSPWGNSIDEQSGVYLCSWLYWTGESTDDPIWLDRYYNPAEYTIYDAMTARPLVDFATGFDNMVLDNPGTEDFVIFDKVSDMCFQPGSLYCYHRLGKTDISNSINKHYNNLIQENLTTYKTLSGNDAMVSYSGESIIYDFTGIQIGRTSILDRLLDTNSFSINYSMYSEDWSKKFGSQLLGNFNNTGFGVFNNQNYTPMYVQPGPVTRIYNTALVEVLSLPISSRAAFKAPISDNVFIYNDDKNGSMYEYDLNGVLRERSNVPVYDGSTYPPTVLAPICVSHDNNYIYLIYDNISYSKVNISTEKIELLTGIVQLKSNPIDPSGEITQAVVVDEQVYAFDVTATHIQVCDGSIVWLSRNTVYEYLIAADIYNVVLESVDFIIRDITTGIDNNKYIIYRDYYPINNLFNYYLLGLTDDNTIAYSHTLSSVSDSLTGLDPDTSFISSYSIENRYGEDLEFYNLAVDCVSSFQVYDPESGESETNYIDITRTFAFTPAGDLISESSQNQPLDTFNKINNQLYDVVSRYDTLPGNNLIFKLRLRNTYNKDKFEDIILPADVSTLDRGWHQFSYDYNATTGKVLLFIDSTLVNSYDFPPGKYRFSDMSIQQYLVGATAAYNGVMFSDFLKQPGYYASRNYKLKDFRIYNQSINYFDIKFLYRNIKAVRDLKWTIPCNSRNYIDEIQHIFKHSRPPVKVDNFDINILSDHIDKKALQTDLSHDLRYRLLNEQPIRSTLDNINWFNT